MWRGQNSPRFAAHFADFWRDSGRLPRLSLRSVHVFGPHGRKFRTLRNPPSHGGDQLFQGSREFQAIDFPVCLWLLPTIAPCSPGAIRKIRTCGDRELALFVVFSAISSVLSLLTRRRRPGGAGTTRLRDPGTSSHALRSLRPRLKTIGRTLNSNAKSVIL